MISRVTVTPAPEKRGTIVAVRDASWRDTLVTFKLWDNWTVQLSFPDTVLDSHEELAQFIADSSSTWVKSIRGK